MAVDMRHEWVDDEINLLDYWRIVWKRRRLVVGLALASTLLTGSYCYFIATKIFESKVAILAPKETGGTGLGSGGGAFSSALSGSGVGQLLGGLLSSTGSNRDTFIGILKSRTMAEDLIAKFDLRKYYKVRYIEEAIKLLQDSTEISVSKEGVISVVVDDKDPKLAADIANAHIANLDRLFAKLGTTDASRQRAFLADRLEKTEKSLHQAEEALRRFQETHKAVVLEQQSRGAIEAAGRVRGEIAAAEVALEALKSFATENNPHLIQQKLRITELKRQLGQMQYGTIEDLPWDSKGSVDRRSEYTVPVAKVPGVGMELVRLMRELKVQETLFALLTQQYEQAKFAEARDTPVVQVLDKAVPAERKSKPKTILYSAIAGVVGLLLSLFLAFFLEYLGRMRKLEASHVM